MNRRFAGYFQHFFLTSLTTLRQAAPAPTVVPGCLTKHYGKANFTGFPSLLECQPVGMPACRNASLPERSASLPW